MRSSVQSGMTHITGPDRSQTLLLPEAVDDYVGPDNPVQFIDAFVRTRKCALSTLPHAARSAAPFGAALDHLPPAAGSRRSLPRPVPGNDRRADKGCVVGKPGPWPNLG